MQLHVVLTAKDAERFEALREHIKGEVADRAAHELFSPTKITNPMVVRYALAHCERAIRSRRSGGG